MPAMMAITRLRPSSIRAQYHFRLVFAKVYTAKIMPKPLISLTFDDGLRCQFERALPILNEHGFRATFFLVANTDPIHTDGYPHPDWPKINWSEEDNEFLRGMVRRGHEIGAHSVHHRQPYLDDNPKFEAEESKRWIEERLGVEIPSYCYPFTRCTDPIRNAVINAGYKQARWGANRGYRPERGEANLYKIDCRHVAVDDHATVFVDGRSHPVGKDGSENVNGWLQPDWYVVMFHGIGTIHDGWWPISVPEFTRQMEELARHRDSGAAEVVTFKDGADRLRTA
jgi:peptidoglycan/xylan/chitin deacetylase (PgdA/CDA1 family)